jgi:Flp pilus assembly protein TadG
MSKRRNRKGQSLIEFTLVCIPLIFLLISIVEISRFMWCYHTLEFAVERGARYAVVHGQSCTDFSASCAASVSAVAGVIGASATGLDPAQLTVALRSASSTQNCAPLRDCYQNGATWPASNANLPGQPVTVAAVYPFRTALSMFWPGAGSVRVGVVNMSATATEEIRF